MTPDRYREKDDFTINKAETIHALYSFILGQPYGIETQRNGNCFNRIIPLKDMITATNNSSGSQFKFDFHTEDAFHVFRPDVLGLACLRNLEKAKTLTSSLRNSQIPDDIKEVLFQKIFEHKSNAGHKNAIVDFGLMPILFGAQSDPFLSINVANLDVKKYSVETQRALNWVLNQLETNTVPHILEQGDCFYVNNLKTARCYSA